MPSYQTRYQVNPDAMKPSHKVLYIVMGIVTFLVVAVVVLVFAVPWNSIGKNGSCDDSKKPTCMNSDGTTADAICVPSGWSCPDKYCNTDNKFQCIGAQRENDVVQNKDPRQLSSVTDATCNVDGVYVCASNECPLPADRTKKPITCQRPTEIPVCIESNIRDQSNPTSARPQWQCKQPTNPRQ